MTKTELFDIVDHNDIPLGYTKSRNQVHADQIDWHRVTGVYVINDQKQLLCQKRSHLKDSDPGIWQNHFGGHVKSGESYEQNALSELQEEIGLQISESKLHFIGKIKNELHHHHGMLYVYRWKNTDQVKLNDGEVEQVEWMTLNQYIEKIKSQGQELNIRSEIVKYLDRI